MHAVTLFSSRWRRAGIGAALLVATLAGGLSGCATNPATGGTDLVFMSEEEEVALGRQYHQFVLSQYDVYQDPALQDYINDIGQKLAKQSHRPQLKYTFTLLDSPEVNAFATPGGYIYITRGIMTYLNSEAELAAVIGHEIGHVTARHSARQHGSQMMGGLLGQLAAIGTGSVIAGEAANAASQVFNRGYGRKMELEADMLGAEYSAKAGYNHRAMLDVIAFLKKQEEFEIEAAKAEARQPRVYHGVFSTHPDKDRRLKEAVESAELTEKAADPYDGRYEYLSMLDGIPYGANRAFRDVVVRGHSVYHHALGIAIDFPRGWRMRNDASKLTSVSRYGDKLITVTTQRADPRLSPKEFLERRMGVTDARDGEVLRGGYPAYTAIVPRAITAYGTMDARFAVIYMGNRAYVFLGAVDSRHDVTDIDPDFFTAVNSLRYMSEQEKAKAHQPKIKLVQAPADVTIEQLAAESVIPKYAVDELRLINGLYPDGEPMPGDLIKIVE